MIFEVLETILILLTSLVHPNHGLDLRGTKTDLLTASTLLIIISRTQTEHFNFYLDSIFAVVFQILLTVFELLLLFVAFPVSLRK